MGRQRWHSDYCGLLVVDKPLHWSSMTVVRYVRRAAGNCKTGHAGTLDPLATGVVICCLGKATRTVEQLMGLTKVYDAEVDLSAFTTTDDREGEREEIVPLQEPKADQIRESCMRFVGTIQQKPPIFSAIHIQGQRAYKLARQGKSIDMPLKTVRIDEIELLAYQWPLARLRITCGRGTYIRSLARDLGGVLGTGGHLASLRRLSVGPYDLTGAMDEKRLNEAITQADLLDCPPPVPSISHG